MFGLFKKPDTKITTDRSVNYLDSLSSDIKLSVVEKIEKFLEMIANQELEQKEAFPTLMQAKQACMVRLELIDDKHPEFSMLQLMEDAYLSLYSHTKLKSGKYSAQRFVEFVVRNSNDKRRATLLLSNSGFDPINLL